MGAKFPPGINLLLNNVSLFGRQETRPRLPLHGMREAVVRTVTRLWILRTSATWFAALDGAFRKGAAAHGPGIG